jgi:hypothetical protein
MTQARSQQKAPNPIQIQKYLGGLDYPVTRREIIEKAQQEGADEDVMEALNQLPEQEYESPIAISREVGRQKQ